MKTLVIIRHAKSNWDNPELSDFERTLSNRGKRDAPFMANLLANKKIPPDLILSSPAQRAYETAKIFAEAANYDTGRININDIIYGGGSRSLVNLLNTVEDSVNVLYLFGHNPDLTSLTNYLTNENIENVPTSGIVCVELFIDTWQALTKGMGKMKFFEYPKMYLKKN